MCLPVALFLVFVCIQIRFNYLQTPRSHFKCPSLRLMVSPWQVKCRRRGRGGRGTPVNGQNTAICRRQNRGTFCSRKKSAPQIKKTRVNWLIYEINLLTSPVFSLRLLVSLLVVVQNKRNTNKHKNTNFMPMIIYSDVLVVIAQIKCLSSSSDNATARHRSSQATTTTEIIHECYLERKVELRSDHLPKYQTIWISNI